VPLSEGELEMHRGDVLFPRRLLKLNRQLCNVTTPLCRIRLEPVVKGRPHPFKDIHPHPVERNREIHSVLMGLLSPRRISNVFLLHGKRGIGKTSVALGAAHYARHRCVFPSAASLA
jgi:hypothetical protein